MKITSAVSIIIIGSVVLTCCKPSETRSGMIKLSIYDYDSTSQRFLLSKMFPENRFWYRDSFVIEEVNKVYINTDINNHSTWKHRADHYDFIDLSKKWFYRFSSLTDTARLLKKYPIDSTKLMEGWEFIRQAKPEFVERPIQLKDTMMQGINYLTYATAYKTFAQDTPAVKVNIYARCDVKGSIFYFKAPSQWGLKCPITKMIECQSPSNKFPRAVEINFDEDHLSASQNKLFDAWIKREKENPL